MNRKKLLMLAAILTLCGASVLTSCKSNKEEAAVTVNPTDDNSQFVTITDVVPDVILEIRYFGTYNFVGSRIDGYEEPTALLTKQAADSLKKVSDDVMKQGYRLKIYDAYRPQKGVDHFVRWAQDLEDTRMKPYFYPDLDKSVLFEQEYIYERSGHTRGSTVDLTLFDMATEKELDMGGTFDWFGPESHPDFCGNSETGEYTGGLGDSSFSRLGDSSISGLGDSSISGLGDSSFSRLGDSSISGLGDSSFSRLGNIDNMTGLTSPNDQTTNIPNDQTTNPPISQRVITAEQFEHRMILRRAMLAHGFKPLDTEWWHFTLRNEPFPDTYFTFPVKQIK